MLVVGSIVIRVDDLHAQIRFWSAALGYTMREPIDNDFALLHSADGTGPNLSLDARRSTEVEWGGRPADADYVILQDPEGNRFCVIDAAP